MSGKKDPELLEIPGAEGLSVDYFTDLMDYQAPTQNIPLQGVAGMSDAEKTTQDLLAKYLGTSATYKPGTYKSTATEDEAYKLGLSEMKKTLADGYDPEKSTYWKGLREASHREEERGASNVRRRGQLGGMLYSEPNMRSEAELRARMGTGRNIMLGELYEKERDRKSATVPQLLGYAGFGEQSRQFGAGLHEQSRQFGAGLEEQGKLNRLKAGSTIGALPREIENQKLAALFNQLSGQGEADFASSILTTATQTGAAQQLLPQWNIDQGGGTSPLGGILGLITALAPIGK